MEKYIYQNPDIFHPNFSQKATYHATEARCTMEFDLLHASALNGTE